MNAPAPIPRLRLRVSAEAEKAIRSGHPWVFDGSVRSQNREGVSGELAVIYDRKDRFLALGLFDPDSPLRVRILHAGDPITIDAAWWRERLQESIRRRDGVFDAATDGYRLIHGESDGWPGLVLDRYASVFVLKLYSGAWLRRWTELSGLLKEGLPRIGTGVGLAPVGSEEQGSRCDPSVGRASLVLRLSRNIQTKAAQDHGLKDGQVAWGELDEGPQPFLESGLRLEAEVRRGQKTGFYLDQRDNRRRVETLASGRMVLNAFSFTGGFSIYAARGGAVSVTDLDISAHALDGSRRNFARNLDQGPVARCRHETVQADAFDWLARTGPPLFDLIVLDPPSLARREADRPGAIRAYGNLVSTALRKLRPDGILLAASCSAHVTEEEFFGAVRASAQRSGRRHEELATTSHPPDHPATFPEARYLKAIYLRFG